MNLLPTIRTLPNGQSISFYSPAQIEAIMPPADRLTPSKYDTTPCARLSHKVRNNVGGGAKFNYFMGINMDAFDK